MTRTAKGTVYRRGQKLWIGFKAPDGRWTYSATGLPVGQEAEARRLLEQVKVRARGLPRLRPSEQTVGGYFERWIEGRRAEGIRSVDDEATRLSKHVLPLLGSLRLTEVQSSHVRELLIQLKHRVGPGRRELAPRTVRHVYNTLKSLFFAAEEEGLVATNPCTFRRKTGLLPRKRDKDPLWRKTAFFEPHEVRAFLEDTRIPEDRRVLYALAFLTGMRFGELSALTPGRLEALRDLLDQLLDGRAVVPEQASPNLDVSQLDGCVGHTSPFRLVEPAEQRVEKLPQDEQPEDGRDRREVERADHRDDPPP